MQELVPGATVCHCFGPNIGFGRANNYNFSTAMLGEEDLFVVVNPDVSFSGNELIPLLEWVLSREDVSCVAPLVLGSNASVQYSAKHNPTLLSLALGRLGFLRRFDLLARYDSWHRNLTRDYLRECIDATYLSGCFLIIPSPFYELVGGFSSRYFLHLEDADLVRRLSRVGRTIHNPIGRVMHLWARGSHRSFRQQFCLFNSFITYCRIWGFQLL
ncbi:MAG: hypothetical protein WCK64_03020 [Synechococcaceae cyanobacterium ELA445]